MTPFFCRSDKALSRLPSGSQSGERSPASLQDALARTIFQGMESWLQALVAWKALVIAIWLVLLFVGERLRPAAPQPTPKRGEPAGGWHRLARNAGLAAINIALSPLIVVPFAVWASQYQFGWRPDWWSGWPGLLIDVLLLDLWIYWWHRANHEWPLLWRFHEVHHLDRFLDSTSALRFHFGEVLLSSLARLPVIVLLDVPIASVVVFEMLVVFAALFHHSNLRLPAKFEAALSRVIITPSIHWVHHHAVRADTDSNYGTVFSFWDPLFGSRSNKHRDPEMPIGVQGRRELPFLALLARPARSRPPSPIAARQDETS